MYRRSVLKAVLGVLKAVGLWIPRDDTSKVQAMINESSRELIIPPGTYYIKEPLVLPNGYVLRGSGGYRTRFMVEDRLYIKGSPKLVTGLWIEGKGSDTHVKK